MIVNNASGVSKQNAAAGISDVVNLMKICTVIPVASYHYCGCISCGALHTVTLHHYVHALKVLGLLMTRAVVGGLGL